ncbi:uncharacterized protein LOC118411954 [Branchiostoma floridae]|uniref:Uncharacterized protein LOC118411954 n=1 Tax=Branchiostoma floridae TaxID=7739 RepID=A0A9J7KUE7_BRAFL|nr:uncharacterized protein LOC118411954 [Branchiostoma floridae]
MLGVGITGDINKLTDNYQDRLTKVDRTLQPWRMLPMTLYGKITLINTLVVSQFTHLFLSLPSPGKTFFQTYEQKIFKFIWNGKPEKIKRKILYNTYDNGGLGLIHLPSFDLTRKASWVPRIFFQQDSSRKSFLCTSSVIFSRYLYPFLQLSLGKDIATKISTDQMNNVFIRLLVSPNPFFKDVLKAWLSFQFKPPETLKEIQAQLLWCNSSIVIENTPIIWEKPLKHGIYYINDLLDTNGRFLSYNGLLAKFGTAFDKLEYNQILSAIPRNWKKKLLDNTPVIGPILPHTANYVWLKASF